jgi:L-fuculose-phosphate aldolase
MPRHDANPRLRQDVLEAARAMARLALTPGKTGNISARAGDGFFITPSGMAYETLNLDDIVFVPLRDDPPPGQRTPSSESPMHRAVYAARPDVHAVVHTHSRHATAIACLGRPIPAFHYMVAVAGAAKIPCVPYATFGSERLSRHVAKGLKIANACLLAHHGVVTVGPTCASALRLACDVEAVAELYTTTLAIGRPQILSKQEMKRVAKQFDSYGQRPAPQPPKTRSATARRGSR